MRKAGKEVFRQLQKSVIHREGGGSPVNNMISYFYNTERGGEERKKVEKSNPKYLSS